MMRSAARSGDRGLADELARRASQCGWGDVLALRGEMGGPTAIADFGRAIRGAIGDPGRRMFRWST
jgi:hypothetical protein